MPWLPPPMITILIWLMQLVMLAEAVLALHEGQGADSRNFQECDGLQHGQVQMCMFIMSPEGACEHAAACLYL